MMKLSKETLNILKNFSAINSNLLLKPGSTIETISSSNSVYATADVTETFPVEFGIYDTNEFLGALSLFSDPDITFDEKVALIKEGRNSIKYFSADARVLTTPTKKIKLPPSDVEFELSAEQLAMIQKTAGVLRSSDVSFVGNNGTISAIVGDRKNSTGNTYEVALKEADGAFKANAKIDNLKFLPGDYRVELSTKKVARFISNNIQYVIMLEFDSQFE